MVRGSSPISPVPPRLHVVVGLKREAYQVIYHIWTISAIYLFIAPELCRNFQFSKTKISKLKLVRVVCPLLPLGVYSDHTYKEN